MINNISTRITANWEVHIVENSKNIKNENSFNSINNYYFDDSGEFND